MADELGMNIKVSFEKMEENTKTMAGILTSMKTLVRTAMIGTAIWEALNPILRPLLTLMRAVFTALFLPLIPLFIPLFKGMASSIKAILSAQKTSAEGGGSPMDQFMAGMGAAIQQPTMWAGIGALIVLGMIGSSMLGKLGGIIASSLGLNLTAGTAAGGGIIGTMLESLGFGGAALTRLTSFLKGVGTATIDLGAATILGYVGFKLLKGAISGEGPWSWVELGAGALAGGGAAGLLWASISSLLGLAGIAVTITGSEIILPAAALIFLVGMELKLNKPSSVSNAGAQMLSQLDEQTKGKSLTQALTAGYDVGTANTQVVETKKNVTLLQKVWQDFKTIWTTTTVGMLDPLNTLTHLTGGSEKDSLGFAIASPTKGSFPLVYSLNQASLSWTAMASNSRTEISSIISSLNKIPKEIVTVHTIKTVYK